MRLSRPVPRTSVAPIVKSCKPNPEPKCPWYINISPAVSRACLEATAVAAVWRITRSWTRGAADTGLGTPFTGGRTYHDGRSSDHGALPGNFSRCTGCRHGSLDSAQPTRLSTCSSSTSRGTGRHWPAPTRARISTLNVPCLPLMPRCCCRRRSRWGPFVDAPAHVTGGWVGSYLAASGAARVSAAYLL